MPVSRVQEVAKVTAALETMSTGLQASLQRQADLERERRLFVSAIAHDLRTPLFMLRGYLEGIEGGVAATPDKIVHYVRACRTKADALERLIADLFAYTRMEYLEQAPEQEPLELGYLLRQSVEGAQPLAAEKEIILSLDGPTRDCPLVGDAQLLARAVENLLDNALRYTPHGGRIWVRWGREAGNLIFRIEDSGPGIDLHDLPHVFTPLYRGEASRNRRTGGAGLGLSIAQRIIQAHGGELTAQNGTAGGAVVVGKVPQRVDAGDPPRSVSVSESLRPGK
jgi:signal transduction histidine kinase